MKNISKKVIEMIVNISGNAIERLESYMFQSVNYGIDINQYM